MDCKGWRKVLVALIAIAAVALKPAAGTAIASIAIAFLGAHAVADSKLAKP